MRGLFAYGTLKKNELAFSQIQSLVETINAVQLSGYEIGIRDSLPVIFQSKSSVVEGELIIPKESTADIFWKIVEDYEGNNLYQKMEVEVEDDNRQKFSCFAFVGKREIARGYSRLAKSVWTSKYDPYLAYSFPILFNEIQKITKKSYPADMYHDYWRYMNTLQEKYLLLTVILEHIALLVIGTPNSTGPNARIAQLGASVEWATAFHAVAASSGITPTSVKDAKKLKYKYGNDSPEQAIAMYYQVRSNLSHQGKGGFEDCDLIYTCLVDLSAILSEYLRVKIIGIEEEWIKVLRSV
jgi:gamma-glutamylcyclotransferase (GGCT)/AIG2-like uncharacterized protein YtfP